MVPLRPWLEGLSLEQAEYALDGLRWAKRFRLIKDENATDLRTTLTLSIIAEAAKKEVECWTGR